MDTYGLTTLLHEYEEEAARQNERWDKSKGRGKVAELLTNRERAPGTIREFLRAGRYQDAVYAGICLGAVGERLHARAGNGIGRQLAADGQRERRREIAKAIGQRWNDRKSGDTISAIRHRVTGDYGRGMRHVIACEKEFADESRWNERHHKSGEHK